MTNVLALLILLVLFVCFFQATWIMNGQAEEKIQSALANTNGQIEKSLTEMKVATQDFAWTIEKAYPQLKNSPDRFFEFTRSFMETNPDLSSVAVAFEPNVFPSKGRWFAPFTLRNADSLSTVQLGNENYEYHYYSWYQIPALKNEAAWIDPYQGMNNRYVASYSVPIHKENGEILGVVVSDVDISGMTQRVDTLSVLPNADNFLVSRDARFIVTTDPAYEKHTLYTVISQVPDSLKFINTARAMSKGEKGMLRYKSGGKRMRLYYAPMFTTGWTTATRCAEKELFSANTRFFNILTLLALLSLLVVMFLCKKVISHFTKPLGEFAKASEKIAKGDFHVALPDSKYDDEIHQLHDSTNYMQQSLVDYMNEIQSVTANKERVESELRIAHDIQMGMVPKIFPPFPNRSDVDLYATLIPAKEVGGDLYDFFISGDKLFFIIGDVSGKGVPASLVMAVARSMFRTLAGTQDDPSKILTQMNDSMSEGNTSDMFVTAFAGVLHLDTGVMEYCNGGHNAPMIVGPKRGEAVYLDVVPNLPVCTIGGFTYEKQSITLKPGTTIFMYTDGLTEAENEAKELYGEDRLEALMKHEGLLTPREMVDDVLNSVQAHVRDAEQSDDLTILAIKYI